MGSCLVTNKSIKKGSHLLEYKGKEKSGDAIIEGNYVAELSPGVFLDAKHSRSIARYVNHSCKPNSKLNQILVGDTPKVKLWITAIEDIEPNTEITIHYGTEYKIFFKNGKCLCSSCKKET